MDKVKWIEKLSTELHSVDKDHQELIEILNAFIDGISANETPEALLSMFQDAIDHTANHFSFEEQVMLNIGYPGYLEHKKHHEMLVADALSVKEDLLNAKSAEDALPSAKFLHALVIKHMVEQDLKIRDFILNETKR